MKAKVIFVIALLCAFTGKVWANPTVNAEVNIIGRTTGSYYAYSISSTLPGGGTLSFGPNDGTGKSYVGTSHYFNTDYTIGSGITMSLHGRLSFANTDAGADVTPDGDFDLTLNSTYYYITDAAVTTLANAAVSGCTVSGTYTKTLTIRIPEGTTFGKIRLVLATHTPLNYCTISGIADCYIDDGVNEPVPTVTLDGQALQQDVDYTLSYTHSVNGGSITVTGAGDYIGWKSLHYDTREPNLGDLHSLGTDIYEIASRQDLDYLARIVNGKGTTPSNNCSGKTFRQTADIAYDYSTEWNTVGNMVKNFTPIGIYGASFRGTFDGQGHTISGIRVVVGGNDTDNDDSLGLFGYLGTAGTVKNVILTDATVYGHENIGVLVGYNSGSVTDCYVVNGLACARKQWAGQVGIIAGVDAGGSITRAYFRDCAFWNVANDFHGWVQNSPPGIRIVSPGANVGITRTGGNVISSSMTTYDDGITLDGTQYYSEGATVNLSYSGSVPQGQALFFDATAGVIKGSTLIMPAVDVVVTAGIAGLTSKTVTACQASFAGQTRYWTTFYHPSFNYLLPAGAQAFTVKEDHALYRIGDGSIIPANCAVVIIADAAELTLVMTESSATPEEGNILRGIAVDTEAVNLLSGTGTVIGDQIVYLNAVYVLSRYSDGRFGFFQYSGTIPANKAYFVDSIF